MTSTRGPVWIGVDVGGTKVLAGVVDEFGQVIRTARRATPGRRVDVSHVEDALDAAVLEVAAGAPIAGVGVAAAGFVDAAGQRVMFAPHLPWQGHEVRERLSSRWGVPVVLDNWECQSSSTTMPTARPLPSRRMAPREGPAPRSW